MSLWLGHGLLGMSTKPKNSILAVMCGVVAMTVIDLSVVNVALPSIQVASSRDPR